MDLGRIRCSEASKILEWGCHSNNCYCSYRHLKFIYLWYFPVLIFINIFRLISVIKKKPRYCLFWHFLSCRHVTFSPKAWGVGILLSRLIIMKTSERTYTKADPGLARAPLFEFFGGSVFQNSDCIIRK